MSFISQSIRISNHQKLEEAKKYSLLEPPDGVQTCPPLEFGLLASIIGRQ